MLIVLWFRVSGKNFTQYSIKAPSIGAVEFPRAGRGLISLEIFVPEFGIDLSVMLQERYSGHRLFFETVSGLTSTFYPELIYISVGLLN